MRFIILLFFICITHAISYSQNTITIRKADACKVLEIPTEFSPETDTIGFPNLYLKDLPKYYKLEIYDMAGNKVFETFHPLTHWKGENQSYNRPCPAGKYSYHLLLKCTDTNIKKKMGVINLTK